MKIIYRLLLLTILMITTRCISDETITSVVGDFESPSLLLTKLEASGDFINSIEFPALIEADELNANLNEYKIIDLRSEDEYAQGRIPGSINVLNIDLYDYVQTIPKETKILLVSNTGQSAAYYLTLLRYAGYNNTYSLRFGIAVWNDKFASHWKENLRNYDGVSIQNKFNHILIYSKPEITNLPKVNLISENIDEHIQIKIKELMNLGFDENTKGYISTDNTMGIEFFVDQYLIESNNIYTICFGDQALFFRPNTSRGCLLQCPSHPLNTELYNAFPPYGDLRSTTDLQTIPPNKNIVLYSYSGQRSAMAVAYLKLLGYNAKSILYGGLGMFYSRFVTTNFFSSEYLASFGVQTSSFKSYSLEN